MEETRLLVFMTAFALAGCLISAAAMTSLVTPILALMWAYAYLFPGCS